jgi:hypothetical protein
LNTFFTPLAAFFFWLLCHMPSLFIHNLLYWPLVH